MAVASPGSVVCVLSLPMPLWERVVAHCINGLPLEACGLLAGREGQVLEVYPTANAARSARIYTVEPRDLLRADREAEAAGQSLIGVWHSHTHTAGLPLAYRHRPGPGPRLALRAGVPQRYRPRAAQLQDRGWSGRRGARRYASLSRDTLQW